MNDGLRRAFWVLAFVSVLYFIADRILFVIFPIYLLEKGFSATEIGIVFSLAMFILLISRTLIGKASDYFGRKKIFSLGLLFDSIATSLFPSLGRLFEFAIVKGVKETAETISGSVKDALIADTFPKKIRARINAKLGSLVPFGRALAMVVGFLVVTFFSLAQGFYFAAFFMLVSFIIFTAFFKERPRKTRITKLGLRGVSYSLKFKIILVVQLLVSINYTAAYFPAFFVLSRNLGIDEGLLFLLLLADYLISSCFAYWSGSWIDRRGIEKTMALSLLGFSVLTALYAFAFSVLSFFLILLGISVFYYIWRIAFKTVLMDSSSSKHRGEQIGTSRAFMGIGDMIGPALGGFLIDTVSLGFAFIAAGAAGVAATAFALIFLSGSWSSQK